MSLKVVNQSVHGKEEVEEMVLGGGSKVEVLWEGVRP